MKKKNYLTKCSVCGKFIGYYEFEEDKILTEFTPDTHFTVESIEHIHKKCID